MRFDCHLQNGRVWTGDPGHPEAESVTILDGRVARFDAAAPPGVAVFDAGGGWVGPGLIDAHLHLCLGGEMLDRLDLSGVTSRADFEQAIEARHRELPPGRWLIASGWDEQRFGGTSPDKSWLRGARDRPVVAYRMDLHAGVVNAAVLAICGSDRLAEIEQHPGGRVERAADGRATGLLVEAALWEMVNPLVPKLDLAEQRAAARRAVAHAGANGLTTVGSMEYAASVIDVLDPLRDELTLRVRVTLLDRSGLPDFTRLHAVPSDDVLAVIGFKAFVDGTLGSRSARLLEPYSDAPSERGLFVEGAETERLDAWAAAVVAGGAQPALHAIGDGAVRRALDVLESAGDCADARIEHAQSVNAQDASRFAGRIVSMQPLHRPGDALVAQARLGSDRLDGFFPFEALAAAGATLAFGSDWPVVSLDPLAGMRAAITAEDARGAPFHPEQAVTPEVALRAYTSGAARALRMQDAGVLKPGALGDLTILDRDPLTANWVDAPPRVRATIVGGRVVHGNDAVGSAGA